MPTRKQPTAAKARPTQYKVFVSSTYLDNRDRRKLVEDAITMAGMVWHGMEIMTASTRPVVEECLRYVAEADLLVGIIAWRYGWQPEGEASITEMEYDVANERLMFLLDPEVQIRLYREKADSLHAGLPVAGFVTQLTVPIDIEDLYVPLRAMVDLRGVAEETFADATQAEKSLRDSDAALDISLAEAFRQAQMRRQRGVVILGDPGAARPPT